MGSFSNSEMGGSGPENPDQDFGILVWIFLFLDLNYPSVLKLLRKIMCHSHLENFGVPPKQNLDWEAL